MITKEDNKKKEFYCRQCGYFYDSDELENGKCPEYETDEYLYINGLSDK
jgi:predicted Zn-ribbon and HTH transcriptional regulator